MAFVSAINRPDSDCLVCMGEPDHGPIVVHDDQHPIHKVCLERLAESRLAERKPTECPSCKLNVTSINGIDVEQPKGIAPIPSAQEEGLNADAEIQAIEDDLRLEAQRAEEALRGDQLRRFLLLNNLIVEVLKNPNVQNLQKVKEQAPTTSIEVLELYLLAAAQVGHFTLIASILSVREISAELRTKIAIAATNQGHIEIVRYLLRNEALKSNTRQAVLLAAAYTANFEILKFSLDNTDLSPADLDQIVVNVAKRGCFDPLELILNNRVITEGIRANGIDVALDLEPDAAAGIEERERVQLLKVKIIELLLQNGPIFDFARTNCIFTAVKKDDSTSLKLLLANFQLSSKDLAAAVRITAIRGNLEILNLLLENGILSEKDRGKAVKKAAKKGHHAIIEKLLMYAISQQDRGLAVVAAANNGHLECLDLLLTGLISKRNRGLAVMVAARQGHYEHLETLLRSGKISGNNLNSAFWQAMTTDRLHLLPLLLKNGKIKQEYSDYALHKASAKGNDQIVDVLLKESITPENFKNAAITAAKEGHQSTLTIFLRKGVSKDILEDMALAATNKGQFEVVNYLLKDEPYNSRLRRIIFLEAILKQKLDIIEASFGTVIVKDTDLLYLLTGVVKDGCSDSLAVLMDHKPIDRNLRVELIHLALTLREPKAQVLETLLSGFLLDPTELGIAVKMAAGKGQQECLEMLLDNGPISIKDRGDALVNAAKKGHYNAIVSLLDHGTISQKSIGQALIAAAKGGHIECITPLNNPSEEARGKAMIEAAGRGFKEIVIALDWEAISESDRGAAVRWASTNGHLEIVKELLKGEISDFYRKRSIFVAAIGGHDEVVKFLMKGYELSKEDLKKLKRITGKK